MNTVVYAHPWDIIDDPGALDRLRLLGADSVALAVNYHSVRAATPNHPAHRIVDAQHSALYLEPDASVWEKSTLIPGSAQGWTRPNSAAEAAAALHHAGFDVRSWLVLTHNSLIGARRSDLTVVDAFGTSLRHALCPSSSEVRDFARRVTTQATRQVPGGTVFEAAGPLGLAHGGAHDKTAGADWTDDDSALLSICFCTRCRDAYRARGCGVKRLVARVRASVGSNSHLQDVLGDDAETILSVRAAHSNALVEGVTGAARAEGATSISLHVDAQEWATGAEVATKRLVADFDVAVHPGRAFDRGVPQRTALGIAAYVSGMPSAASATYAWSDADELHIAHLGLLSTDRIEMLAARLSA